MLRFEFAELLLVDLNRLTYFYRANKTSGSFAGTNNSNCLANIRTQTVGVARLHGLLTVHNQIGIKVIAVVANIDPALPARCLALLAAELQISRVPTHFYAVFVSSHLFKPTARIPIDQGIGVKSAVFDVAVSEKRKLCASGVCFGDHHIQQF